MAGAGSEASKPKGYFFKLLWVRSCSTWCTYTMPRLCQPQLSIRGAATDPRATSKTSLASPG